MLDNGLQLKNTRLSSSDSSTRNNPNYNYGTMQCSVPHDIFYKQWYCSCFL